MIDELALLREMRPETTPPDSLVTLRARRALLRHALAKRTRRRYAVRTLVGVAATAAVLGVVGIVNPNGGSTGATAAAAAILDRSATAIDATTDGPYEYRRSIASSWEFGPSSADPAKEETAPFVDDQVETWIPADSDKPIIQRTTAADRTVTFAVVDQDDTDAADLYRQNPTEPADMLKALRELVRKSTQGLLPSDVDPNNNSDVWGTAFSLVADPRTSDDIRANVLRALALMDGVQVVDKNSEIAGKTGVALGLGGDSLQLLFDRDSDAFLGIRGYPEHGPDWVGPSEPVWTLVFETRIVDSAPQPPE